MKVAYEYDLEPQYGWASIDIGEDKEALIVVNSREHGSLGFTFSNGDMIPACICSAWRESECSCPNVDWSDTDG